MIKACFKIWFVLAGITACLVAAGSQQLYAVEPSGTGVNNFVINKFSAEYVLDNKAIGGSLETNETIDLTFSAQNHGILRAIPASYNGYKTKLSITKVERDGRAEPYSTYKQNDNLVLKIGSAAGTITGAHQYKISYYQERIINFNDGQFFYWDVNGTEWQQPFEAVEATVRYKNGPLNAGQARCFTGTFQSTAQNCALQQEGQSIRVGAQNLQPGETLTMRVPMPTQFTPPGLAQKITDNKQSVIGLAVGLLIVLGSFLIWLRYGKDHKGRGIIVPQYEAPAGLTPGEVGMLYDYKADTRDISATLIDLAVRRYIKIHEDISKSLGLFTKRKYTLELQKNDFAELRQHEKTLINTLFPQANIGAKRDLSAADKTKLAAAVTKIKAQLKHSMVNTYGFFEQKPPMKLTVISWVGIAALLAFAFITLSPGSFVGVGLAVLAQAGFAVLMPRRSHAGVEIYEKIQGLKLFMNTTEKRRLKMMQSVSRPYAEPSKTVELFEKLLPFAIALGVEKSWAKEFNSVLKEAPEWYGSNSTDAFTAGYIASSLSSATHNFSSSFAASTTDSSSSGGGGGGFSGGGGGGGGGGGW